MGRFHFRGIAPGCSVPSWCARPHAAWHHGALMRAALRDQLGPCRPSSSSSIARNHGAYLEPMSWPASSRSPRSGSVGQAGGAAHHPHRDAGGGESAVPGCARAADDHHPDGLAGKVVAALFFCLLNWIGQDYFPPRACHCCSTCSSWPSSSCGSARALTAGDIPRPFRWGSKLWRRLWRNASRGEAAAQERCAGGNVSLCLLWWWACRMATVCPPADSVRHVMSATGLVVAVGARSPGSLCCSS